MQHLECELLALADKILVERYDIAVPYAKTGSIEVECRVFLGSNAYSDIDWLLYKFVKSLKFMHVVQDRNNVLPSVICKICYIFNVGRLLETVAYDVLVTVHCTLSLKCFYEIEVEGGRCLKMNVILKCLCQNKFEVRTLGAVAIVVGSFVINLCHCDIEHTLCPLNL